MEEGKIYRVIDWPQKFEKLNVRMFIAPLDRMVHDRIDRIG